MTIRSKITSSFLLVLIIILLISGGNYFIASRMSSRYERVMQENYKTLTALQDINHELEQAILYIPLASTYGLPLDNFDRIISQYQSDLEKPLDNLSEPNEKKLGIQLKESYYELSELLEAYKINPQMDTLAFITTVMPKVEEIKQTSKQIFDYREKAIATDNKQIEEEANQSQFYMLLIGLIGVLFGLFCLVFLPKYFLQPVKDLEFSMQEVAKGNYKNSIKITRKDELGKTVEAFNYMTAKLEAFDQNSHARLLAEEQRLNTIINYTNEAAVFVDEKLELHCANRTAVELFNLQDDDLANRFSTSDLLKEALKNLKSSLDESNQNAPLEIFMGNTKRSFVREVIPIAIQREGNQALPSDIGYLVVLSDISAYMEKDSVKSSFLETISHELKTPIASIRMSVKLLENERTGEVNPKQQALLDGMKEDLTRLLRITGNLLDIVKSDEDVEKLK